MNVFLKSLSETYTKDKIMLYVTVQAGIPQGGLLYLIILSRYGKSFVKKGFRNEVFPTLSKVVDRLCSVICNLTADTIMNITDRDWILSI